MDENSQKMCRYSKKSLNQQGILCEHADETCYTTSDDVLICTYADEFEATEKALNKSYDREHAEHRDKLQIYAPIHNQGISRARSDEELKKKNEYLKTMRGDDAL